MVGRCARALVVPGGLLLLALVLASVGRAEGQTALDDYFRGQVTALEKDVVTLRYDFSEPDQVKDWTEGVPFPVRRQQAQGIELKEGGLEIRGNTGVQHVARFKGDVAVKVRMRPERPRDVGGLLIPADNGHDFASFTIREFFFHSWDGSRGGQNSIIKFGDQWRESNAPPDFIGFRYVTRRPPDVDLVSGRAYEIVFGIHRKKLFFELGKQKLKGKDLGHPLTTCYPALYVVKEKMLVESVEITGELDPTWLEEEGVALRLTTPLPDSR